MKQQHKKPESYVKFLEDKVKELDTICQEFYDGMMAYRLCLAIELTKSFSRKQFTEKSFTEIIDDDDIPEYENLLAPESKQKFQEIEKKKKTKQELMYQ